MPNGDNKGIMHRWENRPPEHNCHCGHRPHFKQQIIHVPVPGKRRPRTACSEFCAVAMERQIEAELEEQRLDIIRRARRLVEWRNK